MSQYRAPLREMNFVLRDLLDVERHYASLSGCEELTGDLLSAILDGMSQFAEEVLAPLNRSGDEEGCHFDNGEVTTPDGFRDAYRRFAEDGWTALSAPVEYGGQGLPGSVGIYVDEMVGSANWSFGMYPGLTKGAIRALHFHGSAEQQQRYLSKLVAGTFSGTMCLTEAHCGSDLGTLRTKAQPAADGSYRITGTKIFISAGEHDLTENIIHLVLARVEGAAEGTKGISLFIVPKFLLDDDGNPGESNAVACGSIEHKMGIKASVTAVLNFDGATGYLVGEENRGLHYMFTMMNVARVGTALQGLAHGEAALQLAVAYARERLAMRSLSGTKNPDGSADPIIVHADVRRMLLIQKSLVEGSRALLYWLATLVDRIDFGADDRRAAAEEMLALLTPVAKAFITETGFEVTNHALQVFGGHGYIREHGVEQHVRDARIAAVYEGTTGIQALDLLGRKILGDGGKALRHFMAEVDTFCNEASGRTDLTELLDRLRAKNTELGELAIVVGERASQDLDEVGSASVDYLMYFGYVALAYLWARMAKVAAAKLEAGDGDSAFMEAKLTTARFYFHRVLPRTEAHAAGVLAGAASVMAMPEGSFHSG